MCLYYNSYVMSYFSYCSAAIWNNRKLVVPCKKTTNFGLKSTIFIGAKMWNSLPDELRSTTILKEFLRMPLVRELHL